MIFKVKIVHGGNLGNWHSSKCMVLIGKLWGILKSKMIRMDHQNGSAVRVSHQRFATLSNCTPLSIEDRSLKKI